MELEIFTTEGLQGGSRLLAPLTDSILVVSYTLLYVRRSVGRLGGIELETVRF